MAAVVIGLLGGAICYGGVMLKSRLGYDDSLDVVGIHGLGGTWGALATGLFASKAINDAGANGPLFREPGSAFHPIYLGDCHHGVRLRDDPDPPQVVDLVLGIRVGDEDEEKGLDITLHNEKGTVFSSRFRGSVFRAEP